MDALVFDKLFLTKGVGLNTEKLSSFEMALRKAKIASYNLVRVSSIIPPGCKIIPRAQGIRKLRPGQVVFCVLAQAETNESNRMIASSIGLAIPRDPAKFGYISEHHSFGQTIREAGDYSEDLAATMLASTLGVPFDLDRAWDERKEQFRVGGQIVKTQNITAVARGNPKRLWTTVLSAAVFVP
jgi:arginine decarboxylase